MSLIYILISLITITIFIVLKKTNKKENIVLWIILSIILLMCFNIFVTLIFSIIKIKSTLTNLSIAQIILIIPMIRQIILKREIQKFYIKKYDIIISILLLILIVIIAIKQYGFPFNIKYIITDGSVHYLATIKFYNESDLLSNAKFDGVSNFSTFMTGAYVNCGIFLKSLSSFITIKNYYTIFVIFDLVVLFLSGELFYLLISQKLHKKSEYILAYIFTIIYILGYPLNSTLSGFCYLSLGLDIILAIMLMIKYIKKGQNITIMLSLSLLTLGIFFSYYFFVPVVYLAIFIFLIKNINNKKEKILKLNNVLDITYILIFPAILGMYYFFLKEIFTGYYVLPNKAISIDGTIYSNVITNFIIFIPLILIYIIHEIKYKKNNFNINMLCLEIIFIMCLWIGKENNKVSNYYFFKSYYLLWILTISISFYSIILLKRKIKQSTIIIFSLVIIYLFGMIFNIVIYKESNIKLYDIYSYNFKHLNEKYTINYKYLELVEYYYNNLEDEKWNIFIIGTEMEGEKRWMYSLYQNPIYQFVNEKIDIDLWIKEAKEEYLIYYKMDYDYEPVQNDDRYEILFNNSAGAILKKK